MARGRAANGSGLQPRKRADGRWEVRFSSGINPKTGKAKQKSIYGKTSQEVAEKLRKATSEVDSGDYLDPTKMKVREWLNTWKTTYCQSIKHATLIQYEGYIKNYLIPNLGGVALNKLTPMLVQDMLNKLAKPGKQGKKALAYKTIKNIHGCLSTSLKKAVELHYLKNNPATGCSIPRGNNAADTKQVHPFTPDEVHDFMKYADESKYHAIYFMALNTGMRLSEILGLRWSRINFKTGRITVDAQLLIPREKGENRSLGQTKNRKARSFKVAEQVTNELMNIRKLQLQARLQAGSAWNNDDDLVFTNEIGGSIPHSTIESDFQRLTKRSGITNHRFHDLRHTFATEALRHGADAKTISEALGHYSVGFTLDVYAQVSEEMPDNFAALMSTIISER